MLKYFIAIALIGGAAASAVAMSEHEGELKCDFIEIHLVTLKF